MGENSESSKARVIEANRAQMRLVPLDLESMLPADHAARAVWSFVERLDLGEFYERILAREGKAGRPATDPQILLALWIYATVEGVGSAREIERLCRYHLAYEWICGGVNVNHHSLSDFRNEASDLLNGLLTQSVMILLSEGLVEIRRVAQDGMKVRASAGASSFRTRAGLASFRRWAASRSRPWPKRSKPIQGRPTDGKRLRGRRLLRIEKNGSSMPSNRWQKRNGASARTTGRRKTRHG